MNINKTNNIIYLKKKICLTVTVLPTLEIKDEIRDCVRANCVEFTMTSNNTMLHRD